MENKLKKVFETTLPCVEVFVEFYASILGSFRRSLQLNGFTADHTQQIILAIIDPKHKH